MKQNQSRHDGPSSGGGLVLKKAIDGYYSSGRFAKLSPASKRIYEYSLRKYEPIETAVLDQGFAQRVAAINDNMTTSQAGLSHGALCQVLKWAHLNGAPEIRLQRPEFAAGDSFEPWTLDEVDRFKGACENLRYEKPEHAFLLSVFNVGLISLQRISDVLAMRKEWFDGTNYVLHQQKTGERISFVPAGVFRDLLSSNEKTGYLIDIKTDHGEDLPPRMNKFRYAFNLIRKETGIKKAFHGLRPTGAVMLAEAGVSDTMIMALLGHTTPRMTARYRAAASRSVMATQAMTKLSNIIGDSK